MEEAQLSEALSALVDGAVQRLIAAGFGDAIAIEEELRLVRQQNEELQAALEVDEVELSRLYSVLVELEKKCAELERIHQPADVPPQQQPPLQQQQQQQQQQEQQQQLAAEDAPSADAATAGPTHRQQLEWRLARLKQQVKSRLAEQAAELAQAAQREAQLEQQLQQAQAECAKLRQRLQAQAEELAAAQQEAALLRARQAAAGKALQSKPTAPAAPAAVAAAQAEPTSSPAPGSPPKFAGLLARLRHDLVSSLRTELQAHLGPLSAALAQHSQLPLPRASKSPSVQQPWGAPLALLSPVLPGVGSAEAAPVLAPAQHAACLPGSQARPPSPPAAEMEMSEDEAGAAPLPQLQPLLPAAQEAEAPTPRLAALLPPADQQRPSFRFSPAAPAAVPPPPPSQQHSEGRSLPAPPAGSPTPAVAAAIAAAQALAAKLAAEQLALRTREEERKMALAHAALSAEAAAENGRLAAAAPAQERQPPSSGPGQQPPAAQHQQQQQQRRSGAASARPARQHGQQGSPQQASLGPETAEAAASEELPPWLALAASIRAKQLEAASTKAAAWAAPARAKTAAAAALAHAAGAAASAAGPQARATEAAAAPSPAAHARTQLQQWRQIAATYADTEDGLPPPSLPFSVPEGSEPEEVVRLAAAGELPYCCPPCRLVFGSENEYLQHQLDKTHVAACRSIFEAYTGSKLEGPGMQIVKVKGSSPAVQLDAAQRRQTFCCLACSRILQLAQFLHHNCSAPHAKVVHAALRKAAAPPAKRQKV